MTRRVSCGGLEAGPSQQDGARGKQRTVDVSVSNHLGVKLQAPSANTSQKLRRQIRRPPCNRSDMPGVSSDSPAFQFVKACACPATKSAPNRHYRFVSDFKRFDRITPRVR